MPTFYTDSSSFAVSEISSSLLVSGSERIIGSGSSIFVISGSTTGRFSVGDKPTSDRSLVSIATTADGVLFEVRDDKITRVSGSLVVTGSIISTVGFTGSLLGSASYVTASSVFGPFGSGSVTSASYSVTASYSLSSSYAASSSYGVSASYSLSSSYAGTSSWAQNAANATAFPFTGSAIISGSLQVTGSLSVLGPIVATSGSGVYLASSLTASEALAAGDFVNITSGGVRKASVEVQTRQAHGFVNVAYSATNPVIVYQTGFNAFLSGLSVGSRYFLSASGTASATPTSRTGSISQELGVAVSSTTMLVNIGPAILT